MPVQSNTALNPQADRPDDTDSYPIFGNDSDALARINSLVAADRQAVDTCIQQNLSSDVVLIRQLGHYIVASGGKRLRPITLLLSAKACGYQGKSHITLAAVIEFIHTATLLHDDVVDASSMRRGKATANEVWGNEASVLVGDFVYSRAFQMMVAVQNMRVMDILADTTNQIAEGEVMQLMNAHSTDVDEVRYLETIDCKTAKLFESAARLGAVIAGQDTEIEHALKDYGQHLGVAFQLVDDVLDYAGDEDSIGKNLGDDLAEGKPTLPIIQALKTGDKQQRELLTDAIENGRKELLDRVCAIVESTGALAYTQARAESQVELAKQALQPLPNSPAKQMLEALAGFAITRQS